MDIGINNLIAQMQGINLNIHERADALMEFNKLVEHCEHLEAKLKNNVDLGDVSNCDACDGTGLVEGEHFDDLQPCRNC